MNINFHISDEALKDLNWSASITLQAFQAGETVPLEDMRELMVPFVVNANGERLPEAQARRMIGRIKITDTEAVAKQLSEAMLDFLSQRQSGTQSLSSSTPMETGQPG